MIEASLEIPLYYGHSKFKFLDGGKSSNEVYSPIPTVKICIITELKHLIKTPTTIKLKHLIFGAFDQKTSIIWLIGPLGVKIMSLLILKSFYPKI
jgi:hypothetical protein